MPLRVYVCVPFFNIYAVSHHPILHKNEVTLAPQSHGYDFKRNVSNLH